MDNFVQFKKRWPRWAYPTKLNIVLAITALVIGFIGLPPALDWYRSLFRKSLNPVLGFHMSTAGINLESSGSAELSLSDIRDQRVHTLSVENLNEFPLSNLVFNCQFPEAVIKVNNSAPSASVQLNSYENWDKLSMEVDGKIDTLQEVEQFELPQITGLWVMTINSIPAQTSIHIDFVTTVDSGKCFYSKWVLEEGDSLSVHKSVWHIKGTYQFTERKSIVTKKLFLPLKYYLAKRTIEVGDLLLDDGSFKNTVKVRQAKDFRLPGYFATKGYIYVQNNFDKGFTFYCEVSEERLDIDVKVGMFGNPLAPGFIISGTDSLSQSH